MQLSCGFTVASESGFAMGTRQKRMTIIYNITNAMLSCIHNSIPPLEYFSGSILIVFKKKWKDKRKGGIDDKIFFKIIEIVCELSMVNWPVKMRVVNTAVM